MPAQTIHAKIYSRTLGLAGPGPIYTCTKLIAVERRDGAGEFRAEFPSSDTMLERITIKQNYLEFEVGGKFFFFGMVERIWTETDDKGRQTTVVSGRDQLGALAENTVGALELEYSFDAPEQIISAADVPNQNFSLSAEGFSVTGHPFTKQFAGESALSALTKVAADIGEHFRAPKAALLEVVWMSTSAPAAPVRLVTAGGPLLHENPDVAIISHIERDENGESMANRIYPYGAGVGAARLTLEHATIGMPSGYTMSTASNYIQNDAQQSLPSVRKAIQKVWNHIGVDIGQVYTIQVTTTALTGATMIIVETIALPLTTGTLLDLNGGGTDFVELSANVSIGANVLNVVATTFDVLDTDTLVYTNPQAATAAANTLAYAALTHLQRISEPTRMVAYKLTVRGLPDTVTVGMTIPVLSQAPGFAIDDDLIILEITRSVTRNGQMPAVVKVVPVDWFDLGEAGSIATAMEDLRVSQALAQPTAYASITDPPTIPDDTGTAINAAAADTPLDADKWVFWDAVDSILKSITHVNLKATLKTYFDTLYNLYVHPNHSGDVTSVADGATTIANDAVTNAKAADMATATIKGRTTAGAGDPEDLTAAQARTILNVEDGADVTDATNVLAAGAVMTTGAQSVGGVKTFTSDVGIGGTPSETLTVQGAVGVRPTTGNANFRLWPDAGTNYTIFSDTLGDLGFYDATNAAYVGRRRAGGQWLLELTTGNATRLGIKAGTSTNDAAVGGVLYVTTTQTGNVGTGEDDLASYSVPANTLSANGMSLWFEAWGTVAANIATKNIRVRFGTSGTNLIATVAYNPSGGGTWYIRGRIIRTGAATQKGMVEAQGNAQINTSLNQTLSGAVTLKVTGEATTTDDIVLESFIVGWDDQNT